MEPSIDELESQRKRLNQRIKDKKSQRSGESSRSREPRKPSDNDAEEGLRLIGDGIGFFFKGLGRSIDWLGSEMKGHFAASLVLVTIGFAGGLVYSIFYPLI